MTKNNEQIIIDKDKFVEAENQPINQEAVNKFIEQTDKFYIDGVDVSGCLVFNNKWGTPLCNPTEDIREAICCEDNPNCLYKKYKRKEQECDNLQGEISHYEHDLGWCSSLIDHYEEKLMKTFYALHQIQLHNLKIKDKDIHLILKEVKEDLKEYNKMKNEELDKKVKDE